MHRDENTTWQTLCAGAEWPVPRLRLIAVWSAIGVLAASLTAGGAVGAQRDTNSLSIEAGTASGTGATPLILYGQVFDSLVPTAADLTGHVGFVWGDNKNFGSAVGVVLGQYSAGYRATPLHTTNWFYTHHPDWIEYLNDRHTVAYEFGNNKATPLDISNPAVVAWKQADIAAGFHGQAWVDLDNIDSENSAKFAGHYVGAKAPCATVSQPACGGVWHQDYTGAPLDPVWISVDLAYVGTMRSYFNAHGRSLMINNSESSNPAYLRPSDQIALAKAANGSLSEGFPMDACATSYGWINGRPADTQFDAEYQEFIAESGSPFFAIGYLCNHSLSHITHDEAAWATAAFLLGMQNPKLNYLAVVGSGKGLTDYETIEPYPASMNPPIGPLSDPPPPAGSRPYVRNFGHGMVALNPSSTATATVTVPAGKDQFGTPVTAGSLVLQPMTGIVIVTP